MKKKINIKLMSIAALAIVTTLVLVGAVFYDLFRQQVVEDLKISAYMLSVNLDEKKLEEYGERLKDIRITLVEESGRVVFDGNVDESLMDNHRQRPEIAEALMQGEGSSMRKSSTLDKNTFYYAVLLEDGRILRVAREADSLLSVLGSAFPILVFVTALLLLICMGISHLLTKSLLKPIEQMAQNLDSGEEITAYEELVPLIKTIQDQHEDILKNAKIRQEFTANVSHELKTPLTSISGYSELIENGMASEEDMRRFAGEIRKNANRLLTLINDIIQLSEMDANVRERVVEEVNLFGLAQNCVDMLQMNAGKHGITLSLEGSECSIMANKQMMEEVLYNLCDNAIRYNNEGGTVRVGIHPGKKSVMLSVEDTGIGIPKEHQERIFERFYRVDKSRSKSTGGTGLGLAIVKHIVAWHEADMELESVEGKGTKISILFPNHIRKEEQTPE